MCGIDYINQKITNHTGRKTLVQELQKSGFSRDSMKLATRHKNVESLDSYELPREQEQIGMINNLVDNIQCTKRKQEEFDANTFDIDNNYKMKRIKDLLQLKKVKTLLKFFDLHKPLQEINPNNTNLEITMNTNNLVNLINSGVLQWVNLKINNSDTYVIKQVQDDDDLFKSIKFNVNEFIGKEYDVDKFNIKLAMGIGFASKAADRFWILVDSSKEDSGIVESQYITPTKITVVERIFWLIEFVLLAKYLLLESCLASTQNSVSSQFPKLSST
ncbi:hypothetical protein RhiirA5_506872 [Rhizophagus irregularis]|uniref:Uncharacterized protein n=1 Tax=Rhizophagus irregularis TaxID=588596 RepID=A0A2N0NQ53_9GLOM|nr:hypothetical protein RhiirA5_506872 [Rhizophagus irregularis]